MKWLVVITLKENNGYIISHKEFDSIEECIEAVIKLKRLYEVSNVVITSLGD